MENQSKPLRQLLIETLKSMAKRSWVPALILVVYGWGFSFIWEVPMTRIMEKETFDKSEAGIFLGCGILLGLIAAVIISNVYQLIRRNSEEITYFFKMRKHLIAQG